MDQEELRRLVVGELQNIEDAIQSMSEELASFNAEKAEDRNIMRSIQRRLESLHRRVVKLEKNQPPTGK
jgi:chromosome segregation ATPase